MWRGNQEAERGENMRIAAVLPRPDTVERKRLLAIMAANVSSTTPIAMDAP